MTEGWTGLTIQNWKKSTAIPEMAKMSRTLAIQLACLKATFFPFFPPFRNFLVILLISVDDADAISESTRTEILKVAKMNVSKEPGDLERLSQSVVFCAYPHEPASSLRLF